MAKNIVVCSDGTGNTSIKGRGTNVFKVFEAIDLTGHRTDPSLAPQIALYDDGVGTEDFKPLKIFAGMTGCGLSRNVKQLYKAIVRIYDPGDGIFLFGFSRGAFTVRTLAGFIAKCGLLDLKNIETATELNATVAKAYRVYRQCYRTKLAELFLGKPDGEDCAEFKRSWCRDCDVRIRFIGVWDTVDAVGLPFYLSDLINMGLYRFKFPDHHLSDIVDHACHALAIDDERHTFHPLLWDETQETNGRIEQVWFAGAHSNVGGGYPKQGMSLVALDWMMTAAERAGLRFIADDQVYYREHANMDDKLYDPRSGLGIFYRWKLRDLDVMCKKNGVAPKLHVSVLERGAHGTEDYAPGNLPLKPRLIITPPAQPHHRKLLELRARNMEAALHKAQTGKEPLLARVKREVFAGRLSYDLYLASILLLITVSVLAIVKQSGPTAVLAAAVVVGFVAAYLLALSADRRMSAVFSPFWHDAQPDLRDALKKSRLAVAQTDDGEDFRRGGLPEG